MSAVLNSSPETLPWHKNVVQSLTTAWQNDRWPHALLLYGAEGLGKHRLANWIAQAVLCDRTSDQTNGDLKACGECASCKLFAAQTHPDLIRISPEEDKTQISIEQIREASASLAMTSYRQGFKVAIVEPAHQMTLGAANSLLKTLEEPAPRTLLILVTSRPSGLPATIRSRCQQIAVRAPVEKVGLHWLANNSDTPVAPEVLRFAHGAPLRALELAKGRYATLSGEVSTAFEALFSGRTDVTQIAKQWNDDDLNERLLCVDHWIEQKIRNHISQNADLVTGTVLPSGAPTLNISRLFACLDRVRELRAVLAKTALQRELAVEAILLSMLESLAPRRG